MQRAGHFLRLFDKRQVPIVPDRQGTLYGAIETIVIYCTVIGFLTWFTVQFFDETTNETTSLETNGFIYSIALQCVSISGCNITYDFPETGVCSSLSSIEPQFYNYTELFTVQICRNERDVNAAVTVRSAFNLLVQWYAPVKKLHIAELVQPGRSNIPLSKLVATEIVTVEFNQRLQKDATSVVNDPKVVSANWQYVVPGYSVLDEVCEQPMFTAYPTYCGAYRLKPAQDLVQRDKVLSNNWRSDVLASVAAVYGILMYLSVLISKYLCKESIKVKPTDEESFGRGIELSETETHFSQTTSD